MFTKCEWKHMNPERGPVGTCGAEARPMTFKSSSPARTSAAQEPPSFRYERRPGHQRPRLGNSCGRVIFLEDPQDSDQQIHVRCSFPFEATETGGITKHTHVENNLRNSLGWPNQPYWVWLKITDAENQKAGHLFAIRTETPPKGKGEKKRLNVACLVSYECSS